MSYKIDYKFVPVPLDFLNDIINNNNISLSHRVLAVIYRQIFNTNKKEQDKLTISYISKALGCENRRRHIKRTIEALSKIYPIKIENNGQGNSNKIFIESCTESGASNPAPDMVQEPVPKVVQEPAPDMVHTIDIESTIVDSIDKEEMIEMTGDEWS